MNYLQYVYREVCSTVFQTGKCDMTFTNSYFSTSVKKYEENIKYTLYLTKQQKPK